MAETDHANNNANDINEASEVMNIDTHDDTKEDEIDNSGDELDWQASDGVKAKPSPYMYRPTGLYIGIFDEESGKVKYVEDTIRITKELYCKLGNKFPNDVSDNDGNFNADNDISMDNSDNDTGNNIQNNDEDDNGNAEHGNADNGYDDNNVDDDDDKDSMQHDDLDDGDNAYGDSEEKKEQSQKSTSQQPAPTVIILSSSFFFLF